MTVETNKPGAEVEAVPAEDLVTLTIDDVEVSVPKGSLVIRAAERIGVEIPRFCDHPLLAPAGACRQCLVEVADAGNGRPIPKPQASCTLEVADGMVVRTQVTSEVADKAQHGIMEFLLVNHPLDCPICDKGGECPLQNQSMTHGYGETRYEFEKRTYPKPINISAQVLLDRERCVLCARCTRFSAQIAGDPFIELLERGALQQVGIYESEPFESYFSGNTIQICPVGALTSATYRFRARPFDLVSTPSIAEHDACGAAIRVDRRRGTVLRRLAGNDPEVNEEWITDKDRFAFGYATAEDRITHPLVRDDSTGELRTASWPEAFVVAARGLAASGVGGRAHRRSADPRGRLRLQQVRRVGAPHERHRLPLPSALGGGGGIPRGPRRGRRSRRDLPQPGSRGLGPAGRPRAGGRGRDGLPAAAQGVAARHEGLLRRPVHQPWAGQDERHPRSACAPGEEAHRAGHGRRDGRTRSVVGDPGRRACGRDARRTHSGGRARRNRPGPRLAWVPRRAGDRGALDMGCLPSLLPGGRPVADAAARVDMAAAWGSDSLPETPGRDAQGILTAGSGLDALVIAGVGLEDFEDPAGALAAVDEATFVVSLEQRHTEVTRRADVVFPVAPVTDRSGTFVNWEGRLREFGRVFDDRPTLPDLRVLAGIAQEMGRPLGFSTPEGARRELDEVGAWDGTRVAGPRHRQAPRFPARARGLARARHLEAAHRRRYRCRTGTPTTAPLPGVGWPGLGCDPRARSASPRDRPLG